MSDRNEVTLEGTVCSEPETRELRNGSFMKWRMVTKSTIEGRDGPWEKSEYHNVVAWESEHDGGLPGWVVEGARVTVQGMLTTRSYEPRDGGKKVWTTEVKALITLATGDGEVATEGPSF